METQQKIAAVAALLGVAGAVLAGLAVFVGAVQTNAGLVVAEGGILAAFLSGLVTAYSGPAAQGIDRVRNADTMTESELLRLRRD